MDGRDEAVEVRMEGSRPARARGGLSGRRGGRRIARLSDEGYWIGAQTRNDSPAADVREPAGAGNVIVPA